MLIIATLGVGSVCSLMVSKDYILQTACLKHTFSKDGKGKRWSEHFLFIAGGIVDRLGVHNIDRTLLKSRFCIIWSL